MFGEPPAPALEVHTGSWTGNLRATGRPLAGEEGSSAQGWEAALQEGARIPGSGEAGLQQRGAEVTPVEGAQSAAPTLLGKAESQHPGDTCLLPTDRGCPPPGLERVGSPQGPPLGAHRARVLQGQEQPRVPGHLLPPSGG